MPRRRDEYGVVVKGDRVRLDYCICDVPCVAVENKKGGVAPLCWFAGLLSVKKLYRGSHIIVLDTYGKPVTDRRNRCGDCRCVIPCLVFRCPSRHHRGSRSVPWCLGASPEQSCNGCWVAEERRKGHSDREVARGAA